MDEICNFRLEFTSMAHSLTYMIKVLPRANTYEYL